MDKFKFQNPLSSDDKTLYTLRQLENVVNKIASSDVLFSDQNFRPTIESLVNQNDDQDLHQKYADIEWIRAWDIYSDQKKFPTTYTSTPQLFLDRISPLNINQGNLSNCYFIAVVSAMAKNPSNILQRFTTRQANRAGIYLISFFMNGIVTPVVIDDYVPVRRGKPCFAKTRDGELWLLLLEKAWAKINGSYGSTCQRPSTFAMTHLLGVRSIVYLNDQIDKEKLWHKINLALSQNYIITASSATQTTTAEDASDSKHCFIVMSTHDVLVDQSQKTRLIKLRNPWGKHDEWKGEWCEDSPLWTPQLKEQLDWQNTSEGVFIMPFAEFPTVFTSVNMCVDSDPLKYVHSYRTHKFRDDEEFQFFSFYVSKSIDLSNEQFSICCMVQDDNCLSRQFRPNHIQVMLMKSDGEWINGSQKGHNNIFGIVMKKGILERGTYCFAIHPSLTFEKEENCQVDDKNVVNTNLTVLIDIQSTESFAIFSLTKKQGLNFLSKCMKSVALNKIPPQNWDFYLENDPDYGRNVYHIKDLGASKTWFASVYIKNESQFNLKEIMTMKLEGFKVLNATDEKINVDLDPGQDQIILLKRTTKQICSLGYSRKIYPRIKTDQELAEFAEIQPSKDLSNGQLSYQTFYDKSGVCIKIKNQNPLELAKVELKFELENLEIKDRSGQSEILFEVSQNGGTVLCLLRPIDILASTKYSFSISANFIPNWVPDEDLIAFTKLQEKKELGKTTYQVGYDRSGVCIFATNWHQTKQFMLQLTFELSNYVIMGYDSDCRQVEIKLNQNEGSGFCILRPVILGGGTKYQMKARLSQI